MQLPLFPLNAVLFPGMTLPLHVFEERYRMMINACVEWKTPFGVVLIKEGQEVGGPATPFPVGTVARVVSVKRLQDGRMDVEAKGERRFRIEEVTKRRPYVIAEVEALPEEAGKVAEGLMVRATRDFDRYVRLLLAIAGGYRKDLPIPREPVALSWGIAQTLVTGSNEEKQRLLEAATAAERLEMEMPLLAAAARRAEATLRERTHPEQRKN